MKKDFNLLEGPIFQTIIKLALPIMGTSFIQMAYNLIDMIWIGKIGASAVSAVGSAGMYMWLASGISTLAKMGGQVCVGQAIGAKNKEKAVNYATATFQLGTLFALIFSMITFIFYRQMIGFYQLTSPDIISQAHTYLLITCGFIIFNFLNQIFTSLMTSIGNSHHPFIATTIGLVMNIILDPLFIFVFDMKVTGAAIATIIAQIIVFVLMLYFVSKDHILFNEVHILHKVSLTYFKEILQIGIPTGIQSMCFTFISMIITRLIANYSDIAIAVQQVGSQIESISWMSAEGFGSALNAFVAQNYGANNLKRVKEGTISGLKTSIVWGMFTTTVLFVFAKEIFSIFISEQDVIPLGINYLRIIALSQIFMCIEYVLAGSLNGLGKTSIPSTISITLNAARIPMIMVLSRTFLKLNGIWWSISISSILKGIVSMICFIYVFKKLEQKQEIIS